MSFNPTVDWVFDWCYTTNMMKKPFRTVKKNRFARVREIMAEYGFPLRLVMCGKIENGRFYLTNRTK